MTILSAKARPVRSNQRPKRTNLRRLPGQSPPGKSRMVGPGRLELPTSRLSGVRSNHLSYGPISVNSAIKPRSMFLDRKRNVDGDARHIVRMINISATYYDRWSPDWCHLCSKKHGKVHPDQCQASYQFHSFLRKEVIQPQVPLRLPCYDFTPVADPTVVSCLLAVSALPSGKTNSHGVTGGVYKARERIHRGMLIRDY